MSVLCLCMDFSFSYAMSPHAGGCTVNHIPALSAECPCFVLPVLLGHSKATRWRWPAAARPMRQLVSCGAISSVSRSDNSRALVPPTTPTLWLKHCIKPARRHPTLQPLIGVLEPPSRTHTPMAADIPSFTLNSGYKMPSVGMG